VLSSIYEICRTGGVAMSYKCEICGREFQSERGLRIHKVRSHGKASTEKQVSAKPLTDFMK